MSYNFNLSNINITKCNQSNPEYEVMLDALIIEVFGFSFDTWFERKFWDKRYISYSIIEENIMLANLCIFDTDMVINGKPGRAIQFGAVCTRKSARGKGLSRRLMEHALAEYEDIPAFLFANDSVLDFYPRFGFRQEQTYRPILNTAINNNTEPVTKLNIDNPVLFNTIKNRSKFSQILDCLNTETINMFHLINDYPDDIYHLPVSDVIVVAHKEENRLFIADIISDKFILFDSVLTELPFNGIEVIEFGFCPDRLGVTPVWEPVPTGDVMFFIKGDWDLPEYFRFPVMSET